MRNHWHIKETAELQVMARLDRDLWRTHLLTVLHARLQARAAQG